MSEWVAPGTAPPPGPRPEVTTPGAGPPGGPGAPGAPPPPGGAGTPGGTRAAAAPTRTRRLYPRTPTALFDDAFAIVKAQPRTVVAIAAWFVIPVQVAVSLLNRSALAGQGLADFWSDPSTIEAMEESGSTAQDIAAVVQFLGPSLLLPFVCAALTHVAVAHRLGDAIAPGEALRRAGRRSPALFVSWLAVHACELVGSCALVGPLVFMALFLVTAPAIAAEGLGPFAGMKRAWLLATRRFWACLGIGAGSGFVAYLLSQALAGATDTVSVLVGLDWGWLLMAAGRTMAALVITPFVALTTALAYIDLRVRLEGLDLTLEAERAFGP